MRTCISIGDYAVTPYFIPGLEIPVYCMEELCYCVRENAFLLDMRLMNDALVDWIGEKCGLKDLAKLLHGQIHKQGSMSSFTTLIMEYVGLYDREVIRGVEQTLKEGSGLSGIEKRKRQVDCLVLKKNFVSALRGYDDLLARWDRPPEEGGELPATDVRAAIFHNKGVALAHLMRYGQAAECFREAFELSLKPEEQIAFLAAKRMELSDEEYVAFAAGLPENYGCALELEKLMERTGEDWERHENFRRLAQRKSWRQGSDRQKYYEENERLTKELKDSYRDSVSTASEGR